MTIPQLQSYIRDALQPRTPVAPPVAPPATPTVAAPTPVIVSTPKVDKKLEFMKGIKRSTSDYVEFTDAKKWYDWKKKTMITAASHGVADVLNPKYRPMDRELFREQSIFMFAVFKLKLGTLKAKNIMSQFEKRQDAQGLWKELYNKHEEGMGPEDLTNELQDKWKYFKCDHR